MKDILLRNDGSINEEGIMEYISAYGVNTPDRNTNSTTYNLTLLSVAMDLQGINTGTRLKLVSFLISQGAKVKALTNSAYVIQNGGLLGIALREGNFELADLLLKSGAKPQKKPNHLIDVLLALRNEQALIWALKYLNSAFVKLTEDKWDRYYHLIANNFPNYRNSEIYPLINKIMRERIDAKFQRFGLINDNETALILAAKMNNKPYKNTIFVLTSDDIKSLIKQIKKLLESNTSQNIIKFQIIFHSAVHVNFGEFEIDKTNNPPTVRYLHCDPSPHLTRYDEVITNDFVKKISPLAHIEIYDSEVNLQKGLGCSYFSVDGAMMLATPPNRSYVVNLMKYMEKHGKESTNKIKHKFSGIKEKNIKYIQCDSLPMRFVRGSHFIDDETNIRGSMFVSDTTVFNNNSEQTIVNRAGETAEQSVKKDLEKTTLGPISSQTIRVLNLREDRKMRQYGAAVSRFLEDKDILDPAFNDLVVKKYRIDGLKKFCNNSIESKNEVAPAITINSNNNNG